MKDIDWKTKLSGLVNRDELMKKPRVIFGYLSEKDWAFIEFLCFTHASWRYVVSMAQPTGYRIDLVVFAESRWLREMGSICEVVDLNEVARGGGDEGDGGEGGEGGGSYAQLRRHGNESTCFVVPYPRPPEVVWQNYPFVASYHFLADQRAADLITHNYGYAMKTDFDCFITATLIHHFPLQFETGRMHYTPLPGTSERLRRVAQDLGLQHRGRHDVGPTWYGDAHTLVSLARASLPVVYHLLDEEFEANADGSWRQNWVAGEGWPLWSKDMAVMYAPDIVLNHLVENFDISNKYDVHGDTERYTFSLYHIHCQHGDGNFSKFEFFKHKYYDRDVTGGLDFHLVKDYSLWLAVSTWRHVMAMQQGQQQGQQQGTWR